MSSGKTFIALENAREDDQRAAMERIAAREHCPFCRENLFLEHKQPIVREGRYWLVTPNQWPYPNTRVHLLFILKRHEEMEIDEDEAAELHRLKLWARQKFRVRGGGFVERFGETTYSGATIAHFHIQLVTPLITDRNDPAYAPIRARVG